MSQFLKIYVEKQNIYNIKVYTIGQPSSDPNEDPNIFLLNRFYFDSLPLKNEQKWNCVYLLSLYMHICITLNPQKLQELSFLNPEYARRLESA